MRYITGALIAWFIALLQASSIEQFDVGGVAPNAMLVLLVAWLVVRGLDDVLPMVAVAGITAGFIGLEAPGLVLLALIVPIAALGAVRELHIIHSDILLVFAMTIVATLLFESILLASILATGGSLDAPLAIREVIFPATVANVLITPPIYLLMRLARPQGLGRRRSYA